MAVARLAAPAGCSTWRRRASLAWWSASLLAVAALVVYSVAPFGGTVTRSLFNDGLYNVVVAGAALTCLVRGVAGRDERAAWVLLGLGLAAWSAGDVYYVAVLPASGDVPFPSLADGLYLAFYPPTYVAIGLLVRARLVRFSPVVWLDGLIGALAVAALSSAIVLPAVLAATQGNAVDVAVNLAYPLGDALLLALMAGVLAFTGWRGGAGWGRLTAGLLVFAVADTAYLYEVAAGTYVEGSILDVGWAAAAVLTASAVWSSGSRRAPVRAIEGWMSLVAPATFALAALVVLVVDHFDRVSPLALWLSTATLAAVIGRMALTALENHRLLSASERDALIDALTGLGNRRKLQRDIELLGDVEREPLLLVLFDLDGFKSYNDSFGHPAGDALLARLGDRLEAFAGERGNAYRMGGDEFCLLMRLGAADPEALAAGAAAALAESGEGFRIAASHGAVTLADETLRFSEALRLADRRMYAAKAGGRLPPTVESSTVLIAALSERDAALGDHVEGVAELAAAVADRLGLPPDERTHVRLAALVHDVGKMAVPEAILGKRGRLTPDERAYVERHTVIGERILQAAPSLAAAARIVRSSHECWDGSGYPDRLAGDSIPLGARIVFVCDAFDAMIAERPYSGPMTPREALEELQRCAGTQFDPLIVEAFAAVLAERASTVRLLGGAAGEVTRETADR